MNVEMEEEVQMKLFASEPGFGNGDAQASAKEVVAQAIQRAEIEEDIDPDDPDAI